MTTEEFEKEKARDQLEAARAAYAFLNMVRCPDCRLPWPEGFIHFGCPTPNTEEECSRCLHSIHVGRCNMPTGHLGVVSCYCTGN